MFHTFGGTAVEIELDPVTGMIEVVSEAQAFDVGKVINPLLLKMQLDGGFVMGMSIALFESIKFDEQGWVTNPNMTSYYIARMKDVPREFAADFVETPQADWPARRERNRGDEHDLGRLGHIQRRLRCDGRRAERASDEPGDRLEGHQGPEAGPAQEGHGSLRPGEAPEGDGDNQMSFGIGVPDAPRVRVPRPRKPSTRFWGLLKQYGDDAKVMAGGIGLVALMKERLILPT